MNAECYKNMSVNELKKSLDIGIYDARKLYSIIRNPYDGEKIIIFPFCAAYGMTDNHIESIKKDGFDYVHEGYYQFEQGAALFAKKVTHQELVDIFIKYNSNTATRGLRGRATFTDCFEYNGWNFIDDIDVPFEDDTVGWEGVDGLSDIIEESGEEIRAYLDARGVEKDE